MVYKWIVAMRPWSFTASFIPIALGAALAWVEPTYIMHQHFHLGLFILTLIGGIFLQAGTNLLNTYGDYVSNVDTIASAKTCPQIVTGIFPADDVKKMGILMLFFSSIIGFLLFMISGWIIAFFGCIGIVGAYTYTTGFAPYKYKGLGPFFVFFLMGAGMVLPSYYIQAKGLNWNPFFVSLPVAFLVTAIMHANDLRDIIHDKNARIQTCAMWLGLKKSIYVYQVLCIVPFVLLIFLVLGKVIPITGLLPFILLPKLYSKIKKLQVNGTDEEIETLEGWTAQFHFLFGMTFIIGIILFRIF